MQVTVGTFNLNNLFSRFDFKGASASLKQSGGTAEAVTVTYEFTDDDDFKFRKFMGKLVKPKDEKTTRKIAERILAMDVDVLAVQEVEDIDILRDFNRRQLGGLYKHQVLIEGNDIRFIDVGLLSKLPVGAVSSHQAAEHADDPGKPVFSRDLLEVEIFNPERTKKLFTIYNTHLKSHVGDEKSGGKAKNDLRRRRQAESISAIVAGRQRPSSRFMITGDMNDAPTTAPMQPVRTVEGNAMVDGLENPTETRPAKVESDGQNPPNAAWTHRIRKNGKTHHDLFDHIWLSPKLATNLQGSFIDRRKLHGGDGSDHDPAWVVLDL